MKSFKIISFYASVIVFCCLTVASKQKVKLLKRQVPPSPASSSGSSNPHSVKGKSPTSSISEHDTIKAVKMFFENDDLSLQQAFDKHLNEQAHSHTSSPQSARVRDKRKRIADPKLFTDDVLIRSKQKRPAGYDSNAQRAARYAQGLVIKDKVSEEDAIKLGKAKIENKNNRRKQELNRWRSMAQTDPSLARHETTNVPIGLARKHYVPLRAHQLYHQGKGAVSMPIATKIATDENDKRLTHKVEAQRNRRAKQAHRKQG